MTRGTATVQDACRLCRAHEALRNSHVLPAFAFRWLRETSATGYFRYGATPNLRVQDGPKCRLLCDTCEGVFSRWEREFAEKLFHPINNSNCEGTEYGEWLARFAASLCWRTLTWDMGRGQLGHLTPEERTAAHAAAEMWRAFLVGERGNPGEHELHILPMDLVTPAEGETLPARLNFYLARAIQTDVVAGANFQFVYVKLPRTIFIGVIAGGGRYRWKGTRIRMHRGRLGNAYQIPSIVAQYVMAQARRIDAGPRLSPRQMKVVAASLRADPDRALRSDTFHALSWDAELAGDPPFDSLSM